MTMQVLGKADEKVSLLGQARRRFLGLSPAEASFARRGFLVSEEKGRLRLEQIGVVFLSGYHAALEESEFVTLAQRLSRVDSDLRGFTFEGAAMAMALLDSFTPWRRDRWRTFTERHAERHIYMMHVGLGWALARLRRSVSTHLAKLDPLLCWLVVDGYGFHEGYFGWSRYSDGRETPSRLKGYERRVFDQGLGRSIWFVKGANVAAVASAINAFPSLRRDDLWSGVGLACAYAGGCERAAIESLRTAAGEHLSSLAQGVAFAAKTRHRAANLNSHTETACRVICDRSATEVAAITDSALEDLHAEGALPAYEIWRRRIQNEIALEVTRT
jgi:hypothetical protein